MSFLDAAKKAGCSVLLVVGLVAALSAASVPSTANAQHWHSWHGHWGGWHGGWGGLHHHGWGRWPWAVGGAVVAGAAIATTAYPYVY